MAGYVWGRVWLQETPLGSDGIEVIVERDGNVFRVKVDDRSFAIPSSRRDTPGAGPSPGAVVSELESRNERVVRLDTREGAALETFRVRREEIRNLLREVFGERLSISYNAAAYTWEVFTDEGRPRVCTLDAEDPLAGAMEEAQLELDRREAAAARLRAALSAARSAV